MFKTANQSHQLGDLIGAEDVPPANHGGRTMTDIDRVEDFLVRLLVLEIHALEFRANPALAGNPVALSAHEGVKLDWFFVYHRDDHFGRQLDRWPDFP